MTTTSPGSTEHRTTALGHFQAAVEIAHRILQRVDPELARLLIAADRADAAAAIAMRGAEVLRRKAELDEQLGEPKFDLHADRLHPWVWEAAKGLWNDGHHQDAVAAAAEQLDRHVCAKIDSRKRKGTELYANAYSSNEPKPDEPRLRPPADIDSNSDTYKSLRDGARDYGKGASMLIRNIATHERGVMTEQECAEALAALSLLARRVYTDRVVTSTND